jgi:hypothetical protein
MLTFTLFCSGKIQMKISKGRKHMALDLVQVRHKFQPSHQILVDCSPQNSIFQAMSVTSGMESCQLVKFMQTLMSKGFYSILGIELRDQGLAHQSHL